MSSSVFPLLSFTDVRARLEEREREKEKAKSRERYYAMYSSVYGGIVTDESLMCVPMDDHMVHRGHAVFDTACVVNEKVSG